MLKSVQTPEIIVKIIIIACLASAIALPAMARDPKPTDSGVVIHLFGPDFFSMANSANGTAENSPSTPSIQTSQTSQAETPRPAPSMDQILHQLFVTGDPDQDGKPHFPHGRERLQGQ